MNRSTKTNSAPVANTGIIENPVIETTVVETPVKAVKAPKVKPVSSLETCVLLPIQDSTSTNGSSIFKAAQSYPVGPSAAGKLGAKLSYLTGAASWLACAALGFHETKPGKGKMVGFVAAWYCPATGRIFATTGQPLPEMGHGSFHGGNVGSDLVWSKLTSAIRTYHNSVGTECPAFAREEIQQAA